MRTLLMLPVLLAAFPALAADTYRVVYSLVPGTVEFEAPGSPRAPASLPLSTVVVDPSACPAGGTFTADIINGALEVSLDGFVSGVCVLNVSLYGEVEVAVPELGGTSTDVYLQPVVLTSDFTLLGNDAESSWSVDPPNASSQLLGELPFEHQNFARVQLAGDPISPTVIAAQPVRTHQWLPGDVLRFPVRVSIQFSGPDVVGEFRVRYEYRVTVPGPSAALSLPIGAAALAGLSMMRGSG